MAEYIISSGESSDGIILDNTSAAILSGGIVTNATVNSGGLLAVRNGGSASINTINASGKLYVSEGGTVNITTVQNGGLLSVFVALKLMVAMNGPLQHLSSRRRRSMGRNSSDPMLTAMRMYSS